MFPGTRPALACLALLLAPAVPASAGDWYVDAVSGSNGNAGTSPASAWQTITHALASVPDPTWDTRHTIHVAPGVYDQILGEVFPLVVPPNRELFGTAGRTATVVDGNGTSQNLVSFTAYFLGAPFPSAYLVQGFTLRDAAIGVLAREDSYAIEPVLKDLEITGMSEYAVQASSLLEPFKLTMERVVVTGNAAAVVAWAGTHGTDNDVFMRDCQLFGNTGGGVGLNASSAGVDLTVERCRIEGNGGAALSGRASLFGGGFIDVEDSILAGNGGGLTVLGDFDGSSYGFRLTRCTVAHNTGKGVEAWLAGGSLDSSIVYGNADDIVMDVTMPSISAIYTDVGDGDFAGSNGNISADPLFVRPPAGDYHLLFGSPCIDTGNPALALDPDNTRAEMGAYFFDQGGPQTYCTGKTNSLGCVPFITWSGVPSASATAGFSIAVDDHLPGAAGFLIYGFKKSNLGFHGGTLCVKAPLTRWLPAKTAQNTGAPPCQGAIQRNFNNRIQSGADPALSAGATVRAQWLLRDPADPAGFADSLSDGVQFSIFP